MECRDNQKIIASQIIDSNIKLKTIKDVIHELRIEYEKSSKENDIFQEKIAEDRSAIRVHEQNVQDARIKLLEIKKCDWKKNVSPSKNNSLFLLPHLNPS